MIKDDNLGAVTGATMNCITDRRRYILILLGEAKASERPPRRGGGVVNLFARSREGERNRPSRDRVSAKPRPRSWPWIQMSRSL